MTRTSGFCWVTAQSNKPEKPCLRCVSWSGNEDSAVFHQSMQYQYPGKCVILASVRKVYFTYINLYSSEKNVPYIVINLIISASKRFLLVLFRLRQTPICVYLLIYIFFKLVYLAPIDVFLRSSGTSIPSCSSDSIFK